MAAKIRKGDEVVVLAGRDKGKVGQVLKILADGARAYVEGVNMVKKHIKPNPRQEQPGGIVMREASIHLSNLALSDGAGKPCRVGFKVLEDGRKVRYFKGSGELIEA